MRRQATGAAAAAFLALTAGCAPPLDPSLPPPLLPLEDGPPAVEPEPVTAGRAAPGGGYADGVDVLSYDLEVAVSDTADWIRGRAALQLRLTGAPVDTLVLDFTGLAVDRATVDGVPVEPRHAGGRLRVPLPGAADSLGVEIHYAGVPDDGLIIRDNVHGDPSAFVDNWPNRARFWFPGVDHPSDKATARIVVHAPATWSVVANGRLVGAPSETHPGVGGPAASGRRRTWQWRQDEPISTYNMVFGAAVMLVDPVGLAACGQAPASPRPDGCIEVETWLFPESVEAATPSFLRADGMVDYFTAVFGPFPYAKLAHVQSATRFGGMENASAIFYSERALADGRDIEGTVSHEVVHQWFGDAVTEADWRHLWLSEGFATYFGNQFFEMADGPDAFRARMERARERYFDSDVVDEPIVVEEVEDLFGLLNANNYSKGGWVLHMLRGIVGDEAFIRGMRRYYLRYAHGTALTDDFRRIMEDVAGRELDWFFEQWVYSPGYPVLRVDVGAGEGEGGITVRIEQVQDEAWPTFRLPTVVEVHGADGEATRHDVLLDERIEELDLGLDAVPERVVVDPDGWLLLRRAEGSRGGGR